MILTYASQGSDSDVLLLILYIFLALVFSFLCSIAEAVLLSITPSYVAGLREKNPKLAALLYRLKQENVDHSLAAILTLNTIAHTVGAIGAGAQATMVFGSAWFGVFSAVMTLMILLLSEIIPKTLGAVHWRALAGLTARFVRALIFLLYPLILLSEQITKLIARGKRIHAFNRDEFVAMAAVGEASGQLNARESGIIHNLFRFDSLRARDIMTPRTVIRALPENLTVEEALEGSIASPFSRLPVYGKNLDDVTGFVLRSDMLLAKAEQRGSIGLSTLRRDLLSAPAETSLSNLLQLLLDHRSQIALLVDEYGGTTGLVTLEDVVETLLGLEVVDEMDTVEDMQALAREIWSRRAAAIGIDTESLE
ncbi:MAG: hemolysin family protein [Bacteroidota bacterium]|nr:hemolysin family protein [Bacteroidota bacterium]